MNKDLMMRAAVQFKGVWPDQEETHLYKFHYGRFVTGMEGGTADVVCTREQFEDFVESLFEGAPEGTTHFRPNCLAEYYRVSESDSCISVRYFIAGGNRKKWMKSGAYEEDIGLLNSLIPRPVKAEPQAPYMPKVGEECEVKEAAEFTVFGEWTRCTFLLLNICGNNRQHYMIRDEKGNAAILYQEDLVQFRPLRTERELFIEQAIEDYLDQLGSDAVNAKWFGRIFGVMYDAGYRKGV